MALDPHHVVDEGIAEFSGLDCVDDFDREVIKICLTNSEVKNTKILEYSYDQLRDGRVTSEDITDACRKALLKYL